MNRRGLSLLELVFGMTIAAMVTFAFFSLLRFGSREASRSAEGMAAQSVVTEVGSNLQKYLATGDSRFFGFSGVGAGGVPGAQPVRLAIALPGRCADLTTACPADTGFLYTHYDKSLSPAVTVICRVNPNRMLVDLSNTGYGVGSFVPGAGFSVDAAPGVAAGHAVGQLAVAPNRILALSDPPVVHALVATATPQRRPAVQTGPNSVDPPLPPDCISQLRRDAAGNLMLGGLYAVMTEPLSLHGFTGGAPATGANVPPEFIRFPARLHAVEIRTLGRLPDNRFQVRRCQVVGGNIACGELLPYNLPGVTRVRIFEAFRTALLPNDATRFEVLSAPAPGAAPCDPPDANCRVLRSPAAVYPVALPGETLARPSGAGYSLLKQELLQRLRLSLNVGQRLEEFNVLFP